MQRGWVISPDYRALVDALAAQRRDLGVSQRELARRLGKPPSFVNKIELFERRLDILEFIAVSEALGEHPSYLIGLLRDALPSSVTI